MSLTITDEQFLEMTRLAIADEVAANRKLIQQEIIDAFKWVSEETGVELLEIEGKEPARAFRRLMNLYGVEKLKLGVLVRYRWKRREPEVGGHPPSHNATARQGAGISIEELIEKHVVKASSKKRPRLKVMEGTKAV